MRDQYAGDISDLLKFAFLRMLAGNDKRLGIAWYYNANHDGRPDGKHIEHLSDARWSGLDREVHGALQRLPERSVAALQDLKIWPENTVFHKEPVTGKRGRAHWSKAMADALADRDLLFFDPDNGLGTTKRHATIDEVSGLCRRSVSVALIRFPHRMYSHERQLVEYHQLLIKQVEVKSIITIMTNVSVPRASNSRYLVHRQRWFTILNPDALLDDRARKFTERLIRTPGASASVHVA